MDDSAEKVGKLLRQQAAVAGFGSFALRQRDLQKVLNEAARVCADGLGVPFSKVCRYRKAEDDLLIEAGHGWKADGIGVVERADLTSPQGRAFVTGEPPRRLLETAPSRAKNFTMTRTPMFMSAPAAKALTTSGTLVNEGATLIYRANTLDQNTRSHPLTRRERRLVRERNRHKETSLMTHLCPGSAGLRWVSCYSRVWRKPAPPA
jgi:hypothetical protein